ncbi:Anhydro-N-acetylmuramic acid kinase [Streptomyces antimycoticus]
MRVIGLMSGTSHDAVDAAAADLVLDGDTVVLAPLGLVSEAYPEALRSALSAALPPAATTMKEVCALDTRIGQAIRSPWPAPTGGCPCWGPATGDQWPWRLRGPDRASLTDWTEHRRAGQR